MGSFRPSEGPSGPEFGNGVENEFPGPRAPSMKIGVEKESKSGNFNSVSTFHRVLEGAPPRGRQLYFTFPSAPDPLFKASKAPFLTSRVATPSGAPRQAPLELFDSLSTLSLTFWLEGPATSISTPFSTLGARRAQQLL